MSFLSRPSYLFPTPPHDSQTETQTQTETTMLIIGAGGLGCEILKNMAMLSSLSSLSPPSRPSATSAPSATPATPANSTSRNTQTYKFKLHIIDMDTIDLTNLNRQFLFTEKDIGKPKAEVAANKIRNMRKGVDITAHYCKIQDKDTAFYEQFDLVVCGLDSIGARRWINATLIGMANDGCTIPLIDGGTEGLKGQSRVIIPNMTSCYECSLDMLTPQTVYPVCTIANTPRLPEHCIEWASVLHWPKIYPGRIHQLRWRSRALNNAIETTLNTDNPEHLMWVFQTAEKRAKEFQILGVTYSLTQGVVKNIIPAIASTNAIIAASCTNEVFKIVTQTATYLQNYMMYIGDQGIYTYTFEHQKNPDCPVCGALIIEQQFSKSLILEDVLEILGKHPQILMRAASIRSSDKTLYMRAPASLEIATRPNLIKAIGDLVTSGSTLTITDPAVGVHVQVKVILTEATS